MLGTVAKYDRLKSYGFILSDNPDDPDFFVCASFIEGKARWLMANWRVEFTPIETDKGFEAHDVRVIERVIARQVGTPSKSGGRS
jgi:cold shock CspA family protein